MLRVESLKSGYGKVVVLEGLSLEINEGEIVALIGANGAGKTTLLKTISGILTPVAGRITYLDKRIDMLKPETIVELGISHVPQGRKPFYRHTVMTNLEMGGYTCKTSRLVHERIDGYLRRFPLLAHRAKQYAGHLSGGEQQVLAICRALMSDPKLVLMDEPSMGLAPVLVNQIYSFIGELVSEGQTIFLVEQNVSKALSIASRAYVLEKGNIVLAGKSCDLLDDDRIREAYLGV
jgi:branched-chain amino acid transport system ATP-binding protein